MLRKTVPDPYSSDRKSSVAIGWESGTGNRQASRWMCAVYVWQMTSGETRIKFVLWSLHGSDHVDICSIRCYSSWSGEPVSACEHCRVLSVCICMTRHWRLVYPNLLHFELNYWLIQLAKPLAVVFLDKSVNVLWRVFLLSLPLTKRGGTSVHHYV